MGISHSSGHANSLRGVVRGTLLPRPCRGFCEVRSRCASLWAFVAKSLGFTVYSFRVQHGDFGTVLSAQFPMAKDLSGFKLRAPHNGIRLVLCDSSCVPSPQSSYWARWVMPHLTTDDLALGLAPGWHTHTLVARHSELGGSTTGVHTLRLLLPPHMTASASLPRMASFPWAPVDAVVDSTLWATPAPTPLLAVVDTPSVAMHGSSLNPLGLFPSDQLAISVCTRCVFHPSRWGIRALALKELASLWDVPLSVQEFCRDHSICGALADLLDSVPGKSLLHGVDHLLTFGIRGGLFPLRPSLLAATPMAPPSLAPPSPAPFPPSSSHPPPQLLEGAEPLTTPGPSLPLRGFLTKLAAEIEEASHTPSSSIDRGLVEDKVVKKDGQKADDAEVPVHLWDSMWVHTIPTDFVKQPTPGSEWRNLLRLLRGGAIRWWRRKIQRSLWADVNSRASKNFSTDPGSGWVCSNTVSPGLPYGNPPRRHPYDWVFGWTSTGKNRYRKWWRCLRKHPALGLDLTVGSDCVRRCAESSWWEWHAGSALLFWRWPKSHIKWARDGQPHYTTGKLKPFLVAQQAPKSEENRLKIKEKVDKVRARMYIEPGNVVSLTHMFDVPKGTDIRMVYNGTSCGLNDVLYAPHFGLPIVQHTFRSLRKGYYQADMDVGEMFLNFVLHNDLREYSGVDVTHIRHAGPGPPPPWEEGRLRIWERWCRNWMGLTDSPYRSLQMMLKAKHVAYGNRRCIKNPFRWELVILNLPGSESYNPTLPWVMKVRADGHLACEVYVYVDNGRITGWCKVECWRAARRFSSILTHLGIQDASRKRTEPSQQPGPWAGTVSHTTPNLMVTVTEVKWEKTRQGVREVESMLRKPEAMPRKRLEQIRGFLIYVSRTFRWMTPYLKGIHLTIDGWRPDRDSEGWKQKDRGHPPGILHEAELGEIEWAEGEPFHPGPSSPPEAPETVEAVPRLRDDIAALVELTEGSEPAVQSIRVRDTVTAFYLMGDASGKGFGSGLWDGVLQYEAGNWASHCQDESSNWQEANNLVTRVEDLAEAGRLEDIELFLLTDNIVFEGTFYKGHSNSPKLNAIIFRLRRLEKETGCTMHVVHVAGTRMKSAGIDGLSRGDLLEGMMSGEHPLTYVPLNEDANTRSGGRVKEWVESWWEDTGGSAWLDAPIRLLTPEDWFTLYEIEEPRLWIPPPAAMETVVEMFNEDRLVHPHIPHVFAVPRLMTHLWRKQLGKDADVMFTVGVGSGFWPSNMHEPLVVLIVLPLVHANNYRGPWTKRFSTESVKLAQDLETGFKDPGRYGARKFHDLESAMRGPFPPCMNAWCGDCYVEANDDPFPVQVKLEDEEGDGLVTEAEDAVRFRVGRDGDHLMGAPFECDLCHFRNVAKRDPIWEDKKDNYTLLCIRRAILDAFWSRETSTVSANLKRLTLDYEASRPLFSVADPLPWLGNGKLEDRVGMTAALYTLQSSLRSGRYTNYLQWDSMRKTPTWYGNVHEAGAGYQMGTAYARDEKKMYVTTSPTAGRWFTRFMRGSKLRMGVIRRQNEALTPALIREICVMAEEDWLNMRHKRERKAIEEVVVFMLIEFGAALRGEEVPLVVMDGLLQFWNETALAPCSYIMITLRGRFKGEKGLRWHCVPIADYCRDGRLLPLRRWLSRLLSRKVEREHAASGWLFAREDGTRARLGDYDELFRAYLQRVQEEKPSVLPPTMDVADFSLWRSGRRGATTEATVNGVDVTVIELINRWRKKEAARGTEPGLPMRQVYTDVANTVDKMLEFSQGLWVRAVGGF
ncbi:hypothetical protein ACHAXS_009127 [Conticribra weissflogii]